MAGPVETKVQASTAAAAASGLALWALGHYVFKAGVPDVVASWIYVLVPSVLTFGAGYLARHTARTDIPAGNMPADIPAVPWAQKTLLPPGVPSSGPPMAAVPPPAFPPSPPAAPE